MLPAPRHRYSFEEYLEVESIAGVRHEYFDGEIYAMAGGTPEHAAIAAAVTTVVLIDHETPRIELWTREPNGWISRHYAPGSVVPLDAIQCTVPVDEVYAAAREA
jgi:Uma2 family endonuclease